MRVYVDVSGSESGRGTHAISAAGFVATATTWTAFERQWAGALATAGVDQFSMEDFAHSTEQFKLWKDDNERRSSFIQSLIAVAERHEMYGLSTSMRMEDYWQLNLAYQAKELFGGPYALCCGVAANRLKHSQFVARERPRLVEVFVEAGDCNQASLMELCRKDGFGLRPMLRAKKFKDERDQFAYTRPFELADLLAYEARLHVDPTRIGRPARTSAIEMERRLNVEVGVLPLSSLEEACLELRVPRRDSRLW